MKDELFIKLTQEGSALLKLLHVPSDPMEREVTWLK